MLIVVPKCILSQVILNDVHYHKYHYHLQISCQSVSVAARWRQQFCLVPSSNPSRRRYLVVQHALGSESTLFYDILLVFSIRPQVSSIPPAKISDDHPMGTLWQLDRINITGLNKWCHQKKHKLGIALDTIVCIFYIYKLYMHPFDVKLSMLDSISR